MASNMGLYDKLKDQLEEGQTMTFQLIIVVFELMTKKLDVMLLLTEKKGGIAEYKNWGRVKNCGRQYCNTASCCLTLHYKANN